MYRTIKQLEHLSFHRALSKLLLIADRLNFQQISPFIYLNDEYRAEMIAETLENGKYILLFERYVEVEESKVKDIINQLTMNKVMKEKYGIDKIEFKNN
jgi:hypothetical protein